MPLLSREISPESDCCQPAMTHVQRGAQADCTESSCRPTSSAPAWNSQHATARSAGQAGSKMSASVFVTRGRQASD